MNSKRSHIKSSISITDELNKAKKLAENCVKSLKNEKIIKNLSIETNSHNVEKNEKVYLYTKN